MRNGKWIGFDGAGVGFFGFFGSPFSQGGQSSDINWSIICFIMKGASGLSIEFGLHCCASQKANSLHKFSQKSGHSGGKFNGGIYGPFGPSGPLGPVGGFP